MANTVISYPIPPYSNVPIEPQFYKPNVFQISAISLGLTTTVTTTVDINYVIGQIVRLIIPPDFGTRQLNGRTGYVIDIPASNQVVLDISSQGYDTFTTFPTGTQAQILAVGDINNGFTDNNGLQPTAPSIPGAFINISPN